MPTSAAFDRNLEALVLEGEALGAIAGHRPDAPVEACPGWSVAELLGHTGSVHRWVIGVLGGDRTRRSELPGPPPDLGDRLAWYSGGLSALVDAFRSAGPEREVWTFAASGERRAAWWARRMAQETAVHRWDAAAAGGLGDPAAFDPAFAAEGIDEYLEEFLPEHLEGRSGTLHLHATDASSGEGPGEWWVDLGAAGGALRREHAKADAALRGSASDLLLWLWNRLPAAGHLERFGDPAIVDRWVEIRI